MEKSTHFEQLPKELDRETTIFSYGSLLNHQKLKELLKNRGDFDILETTSLEEAENLIKNNPEDIVILKNVSLQNVRTSIVTERMLRRWYQNEGGDIEELVRVGITTREIPKGLFLYARPAQPNEKGRTLNGGLILNLTQTEVTMLDKYEFAPILRRTRTPQLEIGNRIFVPQHISFYAGTESTIDITQEEKNERAKFLNLKHKRGELSLQAKWQKNVRRK